MGARYYPEALVPVLPLASDFRTCGALFVSDEHARVAKGEGQGV